MSTMMLEVPPELEKRINEWSREFKEPPQSLALGLLEEYFDDSDTGALISAQVDAGNMETYSLDKLKELSGETF